MMKKLLLLSFLFLDMYALQNSNINRINIRDYIMLKKYQHLQQVRKRNNHRFLGKKSSTYRKRPIKQMRLPNNMSVQDYIMLKEYQHLQQVRKRNNRRFLGR